MLRLHCEHQFTCHHKQASLVHNKTRNKNRRKTQNRTIETHPVWRIVQIGPKTLFQTSRCKKSRIRVTARSNIVSPALTLTSECGEHSVVRLRMRYSRRDRLSAIHSPALSDPQHRTLSVRRCECSSWRCSDVLVLESQVRCAVFQFVPEQPHILYLIWSWSCPLGLGTARASSDSWAFLAVPRE